MLRAITRAVSRNIAKCELTFRCRELISYERAVRQHDEYCGLLRYRGVEVVTLGASDRYPDCCFVEDTAVVIDELAIIASMGAASRRGEITDAEKVLSQHREIARVSPPATIDGGDVVRAGKRIFVGLSRRTNAEGVEALTRLARPFDYSIVPVHVSGSLHLTTACSVIDDETVILNSRWVDASPFEGMRVLHVAEDEPWAANTMRVAGAVCVEAGATQTADLIHRHHADIEVLNISEFRKAEGSLSCLSIIFSA